VKKNALIEKVMNDPNFTKPEKEIFINDLNSLDDENLAKYLELSNENYGKILEWIRVKQ
jgi:tripartite-type tricarboxylate transporter receptor subunit TctC